MAPQPTSRGACCLTRSEELARRYVPGEGAVAIERLGLGLVNESYRVARDGGVYSLRVPVPDAAALGLDRGWECRVLACATAAGIAPIIECCEPLRGILVTRWVEGRSWTPEQVRLPENIGKTRPTRTAHSRAARAADPPRRMSPRAWIARVPGGADRARRGGESLLAGRAVCDRVRLETRLAALAEPPAAAPVLCHGDLHAQNLIAGGHGLVLLDWEYAHVSEPYWDLAGWIGNNDLGRGFGPITAGELSWPAADAAGRRAPEAAGLAVRLRVLAVERALLETRGRAGGREHVRARTTAGSAAAVRSPVVAPGKFRHTSRPATYPRVVDRLQRRVQWRRMIVVDRDGKEHEIEAKAGLKMMEILRELDYGVAAICGGLCSCATCHVYIDESWVGPLAEAAER